MKNILSTTRATFIFVYVLATSAHAAVSYSITDLGTLGGASSFAAAVNDSGQVVGSFVLAGASHAFVWQAGTMLDLGTFGVESSASGINASGQIVGNYTLANGNGHPFLYDSLHGMQDIGTLGGNSASAAAINDLGQIVGSSRDTGNVNFIPFVYSGGTMTGIASPFPSGGVYPGQLGEATSISSNGTIVGYYFNSDRSSIVPFRLAANIMTTYPGLAGGSLGVGGVNSSGVFVGQSYLGGSSYRAFVEDGIGSYFISTLGGDSNYGYDINDSGAIVGTSTLSDNTTSHAFLYSDNTLYDLNSLVPELTDAGFSALTQARAISDNGYIVGFGRTATGQTHAFLLTPAVVPEPSAAMFGVIGVIGLWFRRNRK